MAAHEHTNSAHTCQAHAGPQPMCVCDHNPGGECHCPPNECKCDQKHHLIAETQQGHHCCQNDLPHDNQLADAHMHDAHIHEGHDMSGHDMHAGLDMGGHGHHGHHGHGGHAGHTAQFKKLFFIMSAVAIPVIGFSTMFAMLLGYQLPAEPWVAFVSPIFGTLMFAWGGWPFLSGGVAEIKQKQPGMMLLIGLAITVAYLASLGASLRIFDHQLDFWWELALLIVIMLLGHWIEMRSLAQTTSALDSLAALLPDQAELVVAEQMTSVSPSDLKLGDIVVVRPGGRVPADGRIVSGQANMDESMITGESKTVSRSTGEVVVAGTISTDSSIRIEITAIGDDTALAGIKRLVLEAQNSSSKAQRIADRAAAALFWFALGSAVITITIWSLFGQVDEGLIRTITVLVIACPHALGLAIPLVVAIATERAARGGVLVKDRLALEAMRTIDAVLFDKTGTLTKGEPEVAAIEPAENFTANDVLSLAAAAEAESEHPLAKAIVRHAGSKTLVGSNFSSSPAVGVSATVDGRKVQVGGPALLTQSGGTELSIAETWSAEGAIILHVLVEGRVAGAIKLVDAVRSESKQAVGALHSLGIKVAMVTGDAEAVAHSVAAELGIDRVFAGVKPADKSAKVRELQAEGLKVAMVGDGVNDAPALAQADVGIAIGAGTDVAIASAGVILASSDPRSVLSVISLSKRTYKKMKQNLWWAAGYNMLSVPLAAGIFAPFGFILPMSVGAVLMSLSTIVVAANAQLLRRIDLRPEASIREVLGVK